MIKGWRNNPLWVHVAMLQQQARELRRMYAAPIAQASEDTSYLTRISRPDWIDDELKK